MAVMRLPLKFTWKKSNNCVCSIGDYSASVPVGGISATLTVSCPVNLKHKTEANINMTVVEKVCGFAKAKFFVQPGNTILWAVEKGRLVSR